MKTRFSSAFKGMLALAVLIGVVNTGHAAFVITDLTPTLWLDAGAGVTAGVDNRVSLWADQSVSGFNVGNATTAQQPLLVENVLNGRSVLHFDGGQTLFNSSVLGSDLFSSTASTVFLVQRKPEDANQTVSFVWVESGGAQNQMLAVNATFGNQVYFRHGPNNAAPSAPPMPTDWYGEFQVLGFQRSGNTAEFRNNGEVFHTATFASDAVNNVNGTLSVGAFSSLALPFNGDIAELIVFNSALLPEDVMRVEAYLGDKYDLTIVPEPSSYAAIFALSCLAAAVTIRSRRRRAA